MLGIGGSYMGARGPARGVLPPLLQRGPGRRPRRPAAGLLRGNNVDNDAASGLLSSCSKSRDESWGVVVISTVGRHARNGRGDTRIFLRELRQLGRRQAGRSGSCRSRARAASCSSCRQAAGRAGDLRGARWRGRPVQRAVCRRPAARRRHGSGHREAARRREGDERPLRDRRRSRENVVLQYVGVCHLLEETEDCVTADPQHVGQAARSGRPVVRPAARRRASARQERGALPLTIVNTRDLHSRGQQHQEACA